MELCLISGQEIVPHMHFDLVLSSMQCVDEDGDEVSITVDPDTVVFEEPSPRKIRRVIPFEMARTLDGKPIAVQGCANATCKRSRFPRHSLSAVDQMVRKVFMSTVFDPETRARVGEAVQKSERDRARTRRITYETGGMYVFHVEPQSSERERNRYMTWIASLFKEPPTPDRLIAGLELFLHRPAANVQWRRPWMLVDLPPESMCKTLLSRYKP